MVGGCVQGQYRLQKRTVRVMDDDDHGDIDGLARSTGHNRVQSSTLLRQRPRIVGGGCGRTAMMEMLHCFSGVDGGGGASRGGPAEQCPVHFHFPVRAAAAALPPHRPPSSHAFHGHSLLVLLPLVHPQGGPRLVREVVVELIWWDFGEWCF
jgi:hypothetical protein